MIVVSRRHLQVAKARSGALLQCLVNCKKSVTRETGALVPGVEENF